jgi:hypothetical protein
MSEFNRKQTAEIQDGIAEALAKRGVNLDGIIKRLAKFWNVDKSDIDLQDALSSVKDDKIAYINSFGPLEGDEGQVAFIKQIAKAKLIVLPTVIANLEEPEEEEEPVPHTRRANREDQPTPRARRKTNQEVDPRDIRAALKKEGSVVQAAKELGITRADIYQHFDLEEVAKLCSR